MSDNLSDQLPRLRTNYNTLRTPPTKHSGKKEGRAVPLELPWRRKFRARSPVPPSTADSHRPLPKCFYAKLGQSDCQKSGAINKQHCHTTTREITQTETCTETYVSLKTDQRWCSICTGTPPRLQKSPNSNPFAQDLNLGAPVPTQSAARKSEDCPTHLAC